MLSVAAGVLLWRKEQLMERDDLALRREASPVRMPEGLSLVTEQATRTPKPPPRRRRRRRNALRPRRVPRVVPSPVAAAYPAPRLPAQPDPLKEAREYLAAVTACRSRRAKFLAKMRLETPLGQRHALNRIAAETQERYPNPMRLGQHMARVRARLESVEEVIAARRVPMSPEEPDDVTFERDRLRALTRGLMQLSAQRTSDANRQNAPSREPVSGKGKQKKRVAASAARHDRA